jgi:hypothetical protein
VADIRVPNHRVRTKIAGLHRGIPWAPTTWPGWVVLRTAGPRTKRHRSFGLSLGRTCSHHTRDAAEEKHGC